MPVIIRGCKKSDEMDVLNICYRTGLAGEDLTGTNLFNDKRLFGYLFVLYYVWYESENGFVAVDEANNKVVGYIFGTQKTRLQELRYVVKMGWRVATRVIFLTSWKYTETFGTVLYFIANNWRSTGITGLYNGYPAHFHINILPEYQSSGIGSKLLAAFEGRMRALKVEGIHLRTSNMNHKAVRFYEKNGYSVVFETESKLWKPLKDYRSIVMAKKLI